MTTDTDTARAQPKPEVAPIPMVLHCPSCHAQHIDEPDERTPDWTNPPHRSHLCHSCGTIWRPADVATVGVRAIQTRGKADCIKRPSVAPDDEALIEDLSHNASMFGSSPETIASEEALRRRLAELRSDNAQLQYALEQSEMRYSEKEAALAACRDKTIEDACAALKAKRAMLIDVGCDGPVVNAFSSAMGVIRALKTQEPTNG